MNSSTKQALLERVRTIRSQTQSLLQDISKQGHPPAVETVPVSVSTKTDKYPTVQQQTDLNPANSSYVDIVLNWLYKFHEGNEMDQQTLLQLVDIIRQPKSRVQAPLDPLQGNSTDDDTAFAPTNVDTPSPVSATRDASIAPVTIGNMVVPAGVSFKQGKWVSEDPDEVDVFESSDFDEEEETQFSMGDDDDDGIPESLDDMEDSDDDVYHNDTSQFLSSSHASKGIDNATTDLQEFVFSGDLKNNLNTSAKNHAYMITGKHE